MQEKEKTHVKNTEEKVKFSRLCKKKKIILIAAIALLITISVVVGFLVSSKFKKSDTVTEVLTVTEVPNDISGAWELIENPELVLSSDDEASDKESAYYVFDTPDKYGRGGYYTCYQGGVEYFKYELLQEDSVEKINLGTENMEYSITGSKSQGNAILTIIFPAYTDEVTGEKHEASEYVFKQAHNPDYEKQAYEEFDTDAALVGDKWINRSRSLPYYYYEIPYTETIEFNNEGIMIIHYESEELFLDRYMYYAYTAKDKDITFSLVTDKDTKYTVSYEFDENGNLRFIEDNTSGSIFADAFFSTVTYYTPDNLPEETVETSSVTE